jgi:predicted nucleic acid-binding protein
MFERVALPTSVQNDYPLAPLTVRNWIGGPPACLELHDTSGLPEISGLDEGETAAIALAEFLHADILLIDEREGSHAAQRIGLLVTGTLGILDLAADQALIDFAASIRRLESTTFRRPMALLEKLLVKHQARKGL